jgi:L-threonylcarbamoyladenylate synthase
MQQVLQQLSFPLAAPSANTFKYVSPVTAQHVFKTLQNKIPLIIDGGVSNIGLESTIIEVENEDIILHRVGGLAVETLENFIGKRLKQLVNKKVQTAGQLKSHYATHTALYVGAIKENIKAFNDKKVAIVSLNKFYEGVEKQHHYLLNEEGDLNQAAQNLFSTLQLIDELNYDIILAEEFPNKGLGVAINDRLSRAQVINK